MKQPTYLAILPFTLTLLLSGSAAATGFQWMEQSASGLGNGYAGAGAMAENASVQFFNPAAMTLLKGTNISTGGVSVSTSHSFSDRGSNTGVFTHTGDGGDPGHWFALGNIYASTELTPDLRLGFGLGSPYRLKNTYNSPWTGAPHMVSTDINSINLNPSIAYRLSDKISLGAGINWQKLTFEGSNLSGIGVGAPRVDYTGDDSAWGWNIGALFTVSPSTRLGLSYRSSMRYTLSGQARLSNGAEADARWTFKTPDTLNLSVYQKLSEKWEMLGDVSRIGWHAAKNSQQTISGTTTELSSLNFRNIWRVALGANYRYNDAWKFKFGVAYEDTPVRDTASRTVFFPDGEKMILSTGAQWRLSKAGLLDVGLSYSHIRKSQMNHDLSTQGSGVVRGEYTGQIWLLGAQYSHGF